MAVPISEQEMGITMTTKSTTRVLRATGTSLLATLILVSAGCGQRGDASGESDAGSTTKTIVVATSGTPSPMTIIEEDGSFTGYEPELLKAADELIAEYDFQFEQVEFEGIAGGLDSGKFQIGANFFNYTPERAEKFTFSKTPHYVDSAAVLATPGFSEKHQFTKLSDLGGYNVPTDSKGSAFQVFVEDFNTIFADNPINIHYTSVDHATRLRQISEGQYDYGYGGRFHQKVYAKDLGVDVEYIAIPDSVAQDDEQKELLKSLRQETYFLFPKTDEGKEIAAALDAALIKLHQNGEMQKLSEQYFGYDMTGSDDQWA